MCDFKVIVYVLLWSCLLMNNHNQGSWLKVNLDSSLKQRDRKVYLEPIFIVGLILNFNYLLNHLKPTAFEWCLIDNMSILIFSNN